MLAPCPAGTVRGPVLPMLETQCLRLTESVAFLLGEGAATYWELEHLRLLWGATRGELTELLHDLDTRVANEYEEATHAMP